MGDPFAQTDLDRFLQPGLRDYEAEQAADNDQEAYDLAGEQADRALDQRVVEGTKPGIELDLTKGIEKNDADQAARHQSQLVALRRSVEGAQQRQRLNPEPAVVLFGTKFQLRRRCRPRRLLILHFGP